MHGEAQTKIFWFKGTLKKEKKVKYDGKGMKMGGRV